MFALKFCFESVERHVPLSSVFHALSTTLDGITFVMLPVSISIIGCSITCQSVRIHVSLSARINVMMHTKLLFFFFLFAYRDLAYSVSFYLLEYGQVAFLVAAEFTVLFSQAVLHNYFSGKNLLS